MMCVPVLVLYIISFCLTLKIHYAHNYTMFCYALQILKY